MKSLHAQRRSRNAAVVAAMLGFGVAAGAAQGQASQPAGSVQQQLFERVFGDAVRLDPAMVAKVKATKPGKRTFVDRNGDGKPEECWFIDDATRHQEKNRPVLVRAIDPNGIDEVRGPNLSSTLYVADWKADGVVDVVLDYVDLDRDGDVDQMGFYFYMPHHSYFGKDVLRVWWGSDDGDDNLLWYDVDYTYYQNLCQYRCHFSGEESFIAFGLLPGGKEWLSAFENPFLFYDPDGDGCSEVVLRVEGHNDEVRAVRYSFDADDDAFGRRTHDYDFSITAYTDPDKKLKLPAEAIKGMTLHGIPTQPWLQRDKACKLVAEAPDWVRSLLTWDEMNANTEQDVARDPYERWEGIIAHGSADFKQVGGPPCSVNNKRNELSYQPVSPMRLYYDASDRRLHMVGANRGWLHVDFDLDGKVDAEYTWIDEDNDGRFDRRRLDLDADGTAEFDWPMQKEHDKELPLEWEAIKDFYVPMLAGALSDSQAFIDAAKAVLGNPPADDAETFFLTKLAAWQPETGLGAYMRKTPAGALFYVNLVRDRLMAAMKKQFGTAASWDKFEKVYASGDYQAACYVMTHELTKSRAAPEKAFGAFARRVPIRIDNRGPRRLDWPTVIALSEIRKAAPDFDAAHCAVVAPQRWLDWREVPHQIDAIEPAIGEELSFVADLPDNEAVTYYLYYGAPSRRTNHSPRTATAEDWVPPNIGWENTRVAYRMYWGQFDFFGKQLDTLIYPTIGKESYHSEVSWGIDALHVGNTCGLGGSWLYEGEKATRLFNPAGKGPIQFTKRQVTSGPVRAAIEVKGANVDPARPDLGVRILAVIYAERPESEIRISVTGAGNDAELAPGLSKLPRDKAFTHQKAGCLGAWGFQEAVIDEVGLGVIVPPERIATFVDEKEERLVRCRADEGKLRYWIVGDWRRGRQHPVAPTIENWRDEMRELAGRLNQGESVMLERAEDVR